MAITRPRLRRSERAHPDLASRRPRWASAVAIGAVVGILAGLTKPTALLAALALAAALVACGRRPDARPAAAAGVAVVLAAVATTFAWGRVVQARAVLPFDRVEPFARTAGAGLDPAGVFARFDGMFTPIEPHFVPAVWRADPWLAALVTIAVAAQLVVFFGPLLQRVGSPRALGIAVGAAVLVSGPFYRVLYWLSTRVDEGAQSRFGLVLLPLAVLAVVPTATARQRWVLAACFAAPGLWYLHLVTTASPSG